MIHKLSLNELKNLSKLSSKKYRKANQQVIVEGENLILQLLENGKKIKRIYITEFYGLKNPEFIQKYEKILNYIDFNDIKKLTETESPQAIIACLDYELTPVTNYNRLLYLDGIQDPGNLGTIIRTALASEIDGIILSPECCELMNPKVIRSSLGAVFFCPVEIRDYNWLEEQKLSKIATCLEDSVNMFSIKSVKEPYILIIGSESQGVNKRVFDMSDTRIYIPMSTKIESLNAAVSTGIILYYFKGLIEA